MTAWRPNHSPETTAEAVPGGMRWFSVCTCGWQSDNYTDEIPADYAGLAHNDGSGTDIEEGGPAGALV